MPSRNDEPERRTAAAVTRLSLARRRAKRAAEPAQEGHAGIGPAHLHALQDRIGVAQARAQALGRARSSRCSAPAGACCRRCSGRDSRLIDQGVDPVEHGIEDIATKRSVRRLEEGPLGACTHQPPDRDVDAAKTLPVAAAILQMVENLQRRAEGIGRGLRGGMLLVQRQQEAADRIGGEAAVVDQLGPVGVAGFHRILAEGAQQVAGLNEPGPVLRVDGMQPRRLGNGRIAADERLLQGVEALELLGGLRGRDRRRCRRPCGRKRRRREPHPGVRARARGRRRESSRRAAACAGLRALRAHGFASAG